MFKVGVRRPINKARKKEDKINSIKASLSGYGAFAGVASTSIPFSIAAQKGFMHNSRLLTQEQKDIVNAKAKEVLENLTNLSSKGVRIEKPEYIPNILDIPEFLRDFVDNQYSAYKGKNAFFMPNNQIIINQDKLPLAVFHEMGHAYNFNNSSFWKTMQQKMRLPGMQFAGLLALLPIFLKEEKAKDGKELTMGQKFKNGLRKYSPALVLASMAPMVLEEGMATLRGNKWAKQVLNKDLAKKVAQSNRWGLLSYAGTAAIIALASFAARKVKDSYINKRQNTKIQIKES